MLWKHAGPNGPEGRCGGEHTIVSCARHLSITGIEGNAAMRASLHYGTVFVVCTLIVCFLPPNAAAPSEGNVRCSDVIQRGELNVLTINSLFSEIADRTACFERIAAFVQSQAEAGRPVDVMLLQEAAGGLLVKTENSAQEFRQILNQHYGLDYSLSTAYASGVPAILTIFNATLSRGAVTASLWRLWPPATELACEGHAMPLTRSVLMTRLQVPGLGSIDVYHTHLCADCQAAERLGQAQQLVSFVQQVETRPPGAHPIVLGGDFNTDLVRADPHEEALYRLITAESPVAFEDSYAVANRAGNSASPLWRIRRDDGDQGPRNQGASRALLQSARGSLHVDGRKAPGSPLQAGDGKAAAGEPAGGRHGLGDRHEPCRLDHPRDQGKPQAGVKGYRGPL
jgi:maltose 6'-phosphate phosphatase